MPAIAAGMTVGLFGGSFNPPHDGHVLVAETALRRLRLHQLWWMVTPGNPLKDHGALEGLAKRIARSEAMISDPRIKVTAFEAALGSRYSAETLRAVKRRHPAVRFVWVMGADNLATFHHWQHWQDIVAMLPIAVIDRPGSTLAYLSAKMAKTFGHARVDEEDAAALPLMRPPAWTFIHGPRSFQSSTALRDGRRRDRDAG